jgi:two-component system, chemotaxis family, protein-glutamate methylesterase/glutaminase
MDARSRVIVIGASAGAVDVLLRLARELPRDTPARVLVALHIGTNRSLLPELLSSQGGLPAHHGRDGEPLLAGRIYVAPPDRHMLIERDQLRLTRGAKEHHARPAVDPLFRSAARWHGPSTVGVVLSGRLDDGTAGLQAIKQCGGIAVVQEPGDASEPSMPRSALQHVPIDHCVDAAQLAGLLSALARDQEVAPMPTISDSLQHEVDLMTGQGDALEHLRHIGTPSTFVCPECHGSLWKVDGAVPPRYRCHTGHGFTQRSLERTLACARDQAIWNALRAVQENGFFLQRMAEEHGQLEPGESERLQAAAQVLAGQVSVLHGLVESAPPAVSE